MRLKALEGTLSPRHQDQRNRLIPVSILPAKHPYRKAFLELWSAKFKGIQTP
jgi:hypothetical protein